MKAGGARTRGVLIVLFLVLGGLLVACVDSATALESSVATTQPLLPSGKQARLDYLASLQAIEPSSRPTKGPNVGFVSIPPETSPYSPYKQVPAGAGFIVESDLGPPGDTGATYTNDWYEQTDAGIAEVYAGTQLGDLRAGFVLVVNWTPNHANMISSGRYPTPRKAGAVTIVGASGDLLKLAAVDGSTFEFDVSGLGYR